MTQRRGLLQQVGGWLSDRLGLQKVLDLVVRHRVPAETASGRRGWMYVFGTAILLSFMLQIVTGIALSTKYVPAPAHAHESIRLITEQTSFGALIRGMHFFGASAMVVLVLIHMARVFLTGSYKFPRELNWITGVLLLMLTLAMAFTGQLLRWDVNGVWGVFVASHYVGRVPLIGEALKEFMLAGDIVGGATLSRFYAFHVIAMPLLIIGLIGIHIYLVFQHGVSEPPEAGRKVDRATYRDFYRSLLERSDRRYFPDIAWRETVFGAAVLALVVGLALTVGPKGPGEVADPTMIPSEPKPDWFLIWYYGLISLKPPELETFVMVYLPILVLVGLIALPIFFGGGERSPTRRPWAVVTVLFVAISLGVLTELGTRAPWVMDFDVEPVATASMPLSPEPVRTGAQLFHARGCQYCHAVQGSGGNYGPALDDVMQRLPPEIVTARIVGGYRDMPAYRDILSQDELRAILAYLHALEEQ